MDAGLAGVLGALAGAVSTAGAALVTGWSARETATIGARAQHLQERRGAREACYTKFLDIAYAVFAELEKIVPRLLAVESIAAELDAFLDTVKPIERARREVGFAGPETAHEAARLATRIATRVQWELEHYRNSVALVDAESFTANRNQTRVLGESLFYKMEELKPAVIQFEEIARKALQDYGARR
ncbi:hypothetical protein NHG22_01325 [Streptomyces sp. ATE26]|uniref:hypothetical protein n=1 Tax=Streptomyces sp. ATE26 TaxID=2954237 RepID=UPI002482793E|nr:hypothetical protein [Streptomyces sp. ATE26]MDI1452471.1 hypothetical protein [Streptomyces sp. ATE26]